VVYRDGVDALFDVITVSCRIGVMKPDPAICHACLDDLGVSPGEALFLDDNSENVKAADRLGLETIEYPTFGTFPASLRAFISHWRAPRDPRTSGWPACETTPADASDDSDRPAEAAAPSAIGWLFSCVTARTNGDIGVRM
jgi:FMN phosphatase YigB (HAD superfamily)